MSQEHSFRDDRLPAPCLVDAGIVANKHDMQRLLADLGRVRYCYRHDDNFSDEAEGYVMEVFADPQQSTLVANYSLYLNVHSFDYLQLGQTEGGQPCFDLMQDNRQLRLVPLSNPLDEQSTRRLNAAALEAVVAEVLSAGWDVRIDDEENFSA